MKNIKHVAWVLLAVYLLLSLFMGKEVFRLNHHSIQVIKLIENSFESILYNNSPNNDENPIPSCHHNWLDVIYKFHNQKLILEDSIFRELISCSYVHMRMINLILPNDLNLAEFALIQYPDDINSLYWVILATDPQIKNSSKPLVLQILTDDPKQGFAWRYLGLILNREGDITNAIEAYKKSCFYGDPGSHGCYNAGRLLEQEGQYGEAISYYRLSKLMQSLEAADRLEAELSSNNP